LIDGLSELRCKCGALICRAAGDAIIEIKCKRCKSLSIHQLSGCATVAHATVNRVVAGSSPALAAKK
jgi:phage FluMu protein Com